MRGTVQDQVGRFLSAKMTEIIEGLNQIGLPSTADDQWRITIVLRNVDHDELTAVFGQDDEAALIVALQIVGASRTRTQYRASVAGIEEDQNDG